MRREVDLVQNHEVRCREHVGVLERLVLSFSDRQHDHLVRLAEVERRRTDQIADVLDEQEASRLWIEPLERMRHHVRVEMAALSGIDLHRAHSGCADALGVAAGLLVAFDHAHRHMSLQRVDRATQQRGLARSGTRQQIEGEDALLREARTVARRVRFVRREKVLLDAQAARRGLAMRVIAVVRVTMQRAVRVAVPAVVGVTLDPRFAFAASAGGAHLPPPVPYSTSSSRTRSSVPAMGRSP